MDIENKKPDGYYDEIEYPFKKKDDIKSFFDKYEIIEHTNSESNYEYLEENDVALEIVNPYRDENLFIEVAGEFTLYFSSWHSHYFTYEYDYKKMKNDALAIINGEYAALCFFLDDEWFGATLLKEEISHLVSSRDLIAKMNFSEEHLQKIREKGVVIFADYWKPNDCYEFDVSMELENTDYTFPRRFGVRFILKDGKCYGSGSMKKYDDETAYINYVYVEDIDDATNLQITVIKLLEADAKKNGLSRIFRNIDISDFDLYSLLGYTETDKIDNDKVTQLDGAIVTFDKTMIKQL